MGANGTRYFGLDSRHSSVVEGLRICQPVTKFAELLRRKLLAVSHRNVASIDLDPQLQGSKNVSGHVEKTAVTNSVGQTIGTVRSHLIHGREVARAAFEGFDYKFVLRRVLKYFTQV